VRGVVPVNASGARETGIHAGDGWHRSVTVTRHALSCALGCCLVLAICSAFAVTHNGFQIKRPLVPLREIVSAGPPRGGIPALNRPGVVSASEADYLRDDDEVMGLVVAGEARANTQLGRGRQRRH